MSTTFYTKFTTVNASGVPTTLGSSPSLQFYVGAGTTAFTVGLSLDADFNSVTGLNHVTVIATTSATAWTSGIDVQVVVATGTVSGVSIKGYKVAEFSLQNRANLRPVTAGRNLIVEADGMAYADAREWLGGTIATPTVTGVPEVDITYLLGTAWLTPQTPGTPDVNVVQWNELATVALPLTPTVAGRQLDVSVGGEAGIDWANVGSPTTPVDLSGTTISTSQTVASVSGAVGSVTGNVGGNVAGSVGSVTAAVAITSNVKKNQALAGFQFLMTDSTNHAPATGLTVTVTRSIDGGAFAAGTLSAVTEVGNGTYAVDFGAGDLNGNVIVLQATAPASDTTFERIVTQP